MQQQEIRNQNNGLFTQNNKKLNSGLFTQNNGLFTQNNQKLNNGLFTQNNYIVEIEQWIFYH